ncbi:hypothetical protein AQPE_4700 [Aquipluma nitroreducens]|uniref:Uncharacterized protein n=1 Tax=Aquipluma nitroreducens TaxID=2010828 RepID=A0A5K7SGF7_9BACT|nr:hypothetical protein AQPE_4700 [Aquipluma nitroreducens]
MQDNEKAVQNFSLASGREACLQDDKNKGRRPIGRLPDFQSVGN